jgi:hypothetical protein
VSEKKCLFFYCPIHSTAIKLIYKEKKRLYEIAKYLKNKDPKNSNLLKIKDLYPENKYGSTTANQNSQKTGPKWP